MFTDKTTITKSIRKVKANLKHVLLRIVAGVESTKVIINTEKTKSTVNITIKQAARVKPLWVLIDTKLKCHSLAVLKIAQSIYPNA